MRDFQFLVFFLMSLMSMTFVILLPKRVSNDSVTNRSRWFMVASLSLIGIQFLIQYIGDYRSHDISHAVVVNLAFFIPTAATLNLSILNLQRQGRLTLFEKWIYLPVWIVVMTLVTFAAVFNTHPTDGGMSLLMCAEVVSSTIFTLVLLYFSILQLREMKRIREVLDNYYDNTRANQISWMVMSAVLQVVMGLFVPFLLFCPRWVLMVYGLFYFTGLFFLWFSFARFIISGEAKYKSEAEQGAEEEVEETPQTVSAKVMMSPETKLRAERAVERWIAEHRHLRKGITSPEAAKEMQLPRYQLSAWVKENGFNSFSHWMTTLRVDYAKHLLVSHPDWSNEAIADQCGISRSHFQKVFRDFTGMTPAQFIATHK